MALPLLLLPPSPQPLLLLLPLVLIGRALPGWEFVRRRIAVGVVA
jgi:hypothetical protein